jgi:hypothetical protein
MASNYADKFEGTPYFIKKGELLSAEGMTAALNTKEKVANKQVDSTDTAGTLTVSSNDSYYPTSKLVGRNLDALKTTINTSLNGKQDQITAGTANDILTKTTVAGTLGTLTKTTSVAAAASASNDKIPTEKAVATALSGKVDISSLPDTSNLQVKLPIGTILMYDGAGWQDNITLPGWYSCTMANNNLNLTPNLEDKFIKGKGSKANTGNGQMTLGKQHLPAHSHSITDKEHNHAAPKSAGEDGSISTYPNGTYFIYDSVRIGGENSWTTTPSVNKSYTGIISTNDNTGGGQPFDVLPSYYSVIYIKRVA